jgi:hypothetical protein
MVLRREGAQKKIAGYQGGFFKIRLSFLGAVLY